MNRKHKKGELSEKALQGISGGGVGPQSRRARRVRGRAVATSPSTPEAVRAAPASRATPSIEDRLAQIKKPF
ncbi:hypothetical protein [Legionella spiritensis]|uniref:hypothetical protein n=1 Tax=Legionella spiritensis TaxID=452 RepID=UPI000F6FB8D5|nr:hypothetical protein [Legionella spiritensis]VEG89942.1 Uncharacterised protein [Legionella spiritensis]